MATCGDVVTGALRKLGVVGAGRNPRPSDRDDAMESLKSLYRQLISQGAFGRLRDVTPTATYVASENERVFRSDDRCEQVTLPLKIASTRGDPMDYGSRWVSPAASEIDRNSRPPRDCAVVSIIDGFTDTETHWIYDGEGKDWHSLHDLTVDSRAPLADRDLDGLRSLLATNVADQFGSDVHPTTLAQAQRFQISLTHRYSQPREDRQADGWF